MEIDIIMRELVGLIFGKQTTIHKEMLRRYPSIPDYIFTEDFSKKLLDVLFVRKMIVFHRWKKFFDGHSRKMLSSHEEYLMCNMAACLYEYRCYQNAFDSFISACALVINLSEETLEKTGVDFHKLDFDIIMVFYRRFLKRYFHKRKGLHRFVDYIRCHKYLACNWNRNEIISSNDPNILVYVEPSLGNIIEEDFKMFHGFQEIPYDIKVVTTGVALAREVLSTTSVELPTLPKEPELIEMLVEWRKKEVQERDEKQRAIEAALGYKVSNVVSEGISNLNSDSKTNDVEKQQESIEQYETIIQTVIRYNHSRNFSRDSASNQIQAEADKILEHLKNTIKSLMEAVDKCDEQ